MQAIEIVRSGTIAQVWLNRPDLRNAFNEDLITEVRDTFAALGADPNIRAIMLGGRGPAFCAGADLNWMKKMASYTDADNASDALGLAQMLRTIYESPKPVVARVHGPCFAGGMGLVAACDIAVASIAAEFCLSEVKLGLIPATISPYVLKAMGEQSARRYFLSAERFTAAEAHRIGFVHELTQADTLDARVDEILTALTANSPNAVRQAKLLVREVAGRAVDDALLKDTADRIAQIRASDEGKEGVKSFLEKRKPAWLMPGGN